MDTQTQPIVDMPETQPSTGAPRTAAATRARITHGLYSRHAVIPGEDPAAFRALRDELLRDLMPICPEEAKTAAQMVMVQWQLERLWAIQTGVFFEYERVKPAQGDVSHPVRLAQCFLDDCANERAFDKLSLQQQRLINLFHKCGRRLDTLREQHRKGLTRSKDRYEAGEQVSYEVAAAPDPVPAELPVGPSSDATSGEIADRESLLVPTREGNAVTGQKSPGGSASAGPGGASSATSPAKASALPATSSPDSGSGEIADRREPGRAPTPPSPAAPLPSLAERLAVQKEHLARREALFARH